MKVLFWFALVAVGCQRRPPEPTEVDPPIRLAAEVLSPAAVKARLVKDLGVTSAAGNVHCAYSVLGQDESAAYLWVVCQEHVAATDAWATGRSGPIAIDIDARARPAGIVAVREPRDGGLSKEDIEKMFPRPVVSRIFADTATANERVRALETAIAAESTKSGSDAR